MLKELLSDDPIPGQATILEAQPDVLLLTEFDFDAGNVALGALADRLRSSGLDYAHMFSARPNSGLQTGKDLDGDGRLGGPRDAQAYGWFSGQGGQAVLSRWPVTLKADYTGTLWQDLPGHLIPDGDPFAEGQLLSSTSHWHLELAHPDGPIALLTIAATPPVFDGPEDRNGRRNHDELRLWLDALNGDFGQTINTPAILLGKFNVDPLRGDGRREIAQAALTHPYLTDPLPGLPTAEWSTTGPLRASYVLPTKTLRILDAGVAAPEEDAGAHRLVWVDLELGSP